MKDLEQAKAFLELYNELGRKANLVAEHLGLSRFTIYKRLKKIKTDHGIGPEDFDDPCGPDDADDPEVTAKEHEDPDIPVSNEDRLKERIRLLESQVRNLRKEFLTEEEVRRTIFEISGANLVGTQPDWCVTSNSKSSPGVPMLLMSDWHWAEVVDPKQINGVNEFNMEIARARVERMVKNTIDVCFHHMVNPDYPGIVLGLAGDLIGGDIHEELMATNEVEVMPTILDLLDVLISVVKSFKAKFKRVFVVGVSGNHGRNTKKIRMKGRNATNFDWLICQLLHRHFQEDPDIHFQIPDGPDAHFRIYNTRYLMTHGDQFSGGDGVIGPLGPIIRGDHKKRTRNGQIDMDYDVMLMGHWHQYIALKRVIVNSSLKGYDEYAYSNNFPFEEPIQALWFTHPTRGVTSHWPIYVNEKPAVGSDSGWVSWKE